MVWLPEFAPAAFSYLAEVPDSNADTIDLKTLNIDIVHEADGTSVARLDSGQSLIFSTKSATSTLGILLPLDDHWHTRVAAALRLRDQILGLVPSKDFLTRQQRTRIILACRMLDARERSASYRTIARHLFGPSRVAGEPWKTSSLKAQIARLMAHGMRLTEFGYRSILLGRSPTARPD